MRQRPADFASSTSSAPLALEGLRPTRRLTRRSGATHLAPRAGKRADPDQALRELLESCPVPEHLLDFARRLADDDRAEI